MHVARLAHTGITHHQRKGLIRIRDELDEISPEPLGKAYLRLFEISSLMISPQEMAVSMVKDTG